jgi:hypothetical protein
MFSSMRLAVEQAVSRMQFARNGAKAAFGDYYDDLAALGKKVNKLLPRIVAAIKAAGGQVDSVEKHDSKSSASIRFPTKGDYQVSIDIGSTYLAVNRYVIRGAGVLQSVHLFNGELSDIDKAVAIAVNEWKKLKAARRHFSHTGAKELHMKSTYAVVHPSISGMPLDPYNDRVPILLKDKTTVYAINNRSIGQWSIEGRPEMPTGRMFKHLLERMTAAGFSHTGAKAINGVNSNSNEFISLFRQKYLRHINGLIKDLALDYPALNYNSSLKQIIEILHELKENADDAGVPLPKAVNEAYESARRGHFSRNGKTSMAQSDFKVGDQVHLGFAQKGGTGFDGIITKIEGETVYIKSPEEGRYGARTFKGLVSFLTHGYAGYHADQHSRVGSKTNMNQIANHPQKFSKPYPLPSSITRQLNYVESSINNIKMAFEIGDASIANVSASDLVNVVSRLARMVAVAAKSATDSGEWSRKSSGASSTPSQYAKWTDQGYTEKQAWAIAHDESRQKTT